MHTCQYAAAALMPCAKVNTPTAAAMQCTDASIPTAAATQCPNVNMRPPPPCNAQMSIPQPPPLCAEQMSIRGRRRYAMHKYQYADAAAVQCTDVNTPTAAAVQCTNVNTPTAAAMQGTNVNMRPPPRTHAHWRGTAQPNSATMMCGCTLFFARRLRRSLSPKVASYNN